MRAEILTPGELNSEDIESLWQQGVSMDDWDYIVLAPVESVTMRDVYDTWDSTTRIEYEQSEWTFDRIMVGCCDNRWYKATFRGEEYAVGVAYHA